MTELGQDVDRPVAVFDMDGVLLHGDALGSFLRHRLSRSPAHLVAAGASWPWLVGAAAMRRTRRRAIKGFLDIALAGLSDPEYAAAVADYGAALAQREDRVVHQAVAEARALADAGHRVIIVTGCEQRLARAYADAVGLADVELLGTQMTLHRRWPIDLVFHNYGERKLEALAGAGVAAPWAIAYTDALSDVPILRGAERAVLVNPDDWLRARVTSKLGRVADEVSWRAVQVTRQDRRRVA